MCWLKTSMWGMVGALQWSGQLEQIVSTLTGRFLILVVILLSAVWTMPYERLEWIRRFFRPGSDEGG